MKRLLLISILSMGVFANENVDKALEYIQKKEFKQARILLEQESKKGDAIAQYKLAVIYERGQGIKQDYKKAVELYKKSADQGFTQAQSTLNILCQEYSLGCTQ